MSRRSHRQRAHEVALELIATPPSEVKIVWEISDPLDTPPSDKGAWRLETRITPHQPVSISV